MGIYFEAVALKDKKPNHLMFTDRRVGLVNLKINDIITIKPGIAIDYEYYISRGYTHWIKPVSKKILKEKLCNQ